MWRLFSKKSNHVWVIYEMWDAPGRVSIRGCYADHEEMDKEYNRLRALHPDKKYGVQMTQLK